MKRSQVPLIFLLTVFLLVPALAEKKPPVPLSTVNFLVVRDENGKPVRNAAVVLHPVEDNGKQSRGGIELKTDEEITIKLKRPDKQYSIYEDHANEKQQKDQKPQ
jgi:hypothetical protein